MPVEPPTEQATSPRIAASLDQIVTAIQALTTRELDRIQAFAKHRVTLLGNKQRGRDHEDLIQEAITAALRGDRRWYQNVDFCHYLYWAISSISNKWISSDKEVGAENESDLISITDEGTAWNPVEKVPTQASTPEQQASEREQLAVIERLLKDDSAALRIFGFLRRGYKGSDIQQVTGLTRSAYETIAKRIREKVRRSHAL